VKIGITRLLKIEMLKKATKRKLSQRTTMNNI